jgi:spore germination cell wall hydrolase CwlJ-like protein
VCGVVFQGAERATGCQFSFVCNGALGPPAEPDAWRRAGAVAQKALGGFVYKPMENATHFHATYVTPYWSGGMTRIGLIGRHIFYR